MFKKKKLEKIAVSLFDCFGVSQPRSQGFSPRRRKALGTRLGVSLFSNVP